jgi:hypothetical protein
MAFRASQNEPSKAEPKNQSLCESKNKYEKKKQQKAETITLFE